MGFFSSLFAAGDEVSAVERYRIVLRTAPVETIEQVHAQAFAQLTDAQRAVIYEELSRGAGTGERPLSSEPATLARAASRAEARTPGALERSFGPSAAIRDLVADRVVRSPLVSAFLPWDPARAEAAS